MAAPWLTGMNPEQAAVIAHTDGPAFVGASAGTGKTRAMVNRIARLIHDGVAAERILACTFSKKGAGEMNDRLRRDLGVDDARVGTWHSVAFQILREDHCAQSRWTLDEKDRHKTFVKTSVDYKHLDWKGADVTKLRSYIGICKAHMVLPHDPKAMDLARERFGMDASRARDAYSMSDDLTHSAGVLTFDDMLVFAARHLADPDNARKWAGKWDYLITDEAQDDSPVQRFMARALASEHRNYCIVGDVSQSLYSFRGSDPRLFASFSEEWQAQQYFLNRNYRCGRVIVEAANKVIAHNTLKMPVDMIAERGTEGVVEVHRAPDLEDEAAQVAALVQERTADGMEYKDFFVLFRTNAQSRALEDKMIREKIPYVVIGGACFYERKEVKDLLAYLRVALGRDPDGDSVRRCINAPFRFLGKAFVDRLMAVAADGEESDDWLAMVEAAAQQAGIQRRQVTTAAEWCELIEAIDPKVNPGRQLADLVRKTRYVEWLTKEEGEESIEQSSASNVRELIRVAMEFSTPADLLDYIDRNIAEQKKQRDKKGGDRVTLMSCHRSKGLEAPIVWVVGCNEKILPHAKGDIEEERRIFYVACTRARDELHLSYVGSAATGAGVTALVPSRFLREAGLDADTATRVAAGEEVA